MTTYNTDTSNDDNLKPSTGIGKFDASYNDANGKFEITIKYKVGYTDTNSAWTDQNEKDAFRDQFFNLAKTTWEGKFRFTGSGTHDGETATPEFTLSEVTDGSEHFELNVNAGHGGSALIGGVKLQLHQTDNSTYQTHTPAAGKTSLKVREEASLLNEYATPQGTAMGVVGDLTLTRPNGTSTTWSLNQASQNALNTFATAVQDYRTVEPRFPFYITIKTALDAKYNAVKTAIENHLSGRNCTYPVEFVRETHSKVGRTKGKTSITVNTSHKTNPVADFLNYWKSSGWHHTYKVSPHEFGHCLGLPDEYMTYDTMPTLQNAHTAWETLCSNANVSNNSYIKHNYSIMSQGTLFAPCHAVTLWERLEEITTAGSWAIQMVDANSTKQY